MTSSLETNTQKNIEIIKQFYAGLNQNHIDAILNLLDENIVRIEFDAEAFKGLSLMKQNLVSGRSTWAEGACTPLEFFSNGKKLVVDVHIKVRRKNETQWIDAHVADVFSIQNGLIMEFHSFFTKQKAFAWAGISE